MEENKKNRVVWVDNCKGIAVFLVILGHLPLDDFVSKVIYAFHMPLFFIIGGLFVEKSLNKPFIKFVLPKFDSLIIPYLVISLWVYIPYYEIREIFMPTENEVHQNIPYHIVGTILATRASWRFICYIWFLPAMFMSLTILWIVWRISEPYRFISVIIISSIGFLYARYIHVALPCVAFIAILFIYIGVNIARYPSLINWKTAIFGLIVLIVVSHVNIKTGVFEMTYGNICLFLLGAVFGSVFLMRVSQSIPKIFILTTGGGNSLIVYALHQLVIGFFSYPARLMPFHGKAGWTSLISISVAFFIFIVLVGIAIYLNKRVPILCGKQKK